MNYRESVLKVARSMNLVDPQEKLHGLNSLNMIDFVVELEIAAGLEIPNTLMRPEAFESIDSVLLMLSQIQTRSS